jgi:hypothetical protein
MCGHLTDPLFNPSHESNHPSEIRDELVSQKFVGQAALDICDQWNSKPPTDNPANNDSLMEMCMDNVGTGFTARGENLPQE